MYNYQIEASDLNRVPFSVEAAQRHYYQSQTVNPAVASCCGDKLWQPEAGDNPREWKRKKKKRSHKDTDARWTKKRGETFFGYKNHTNVALTNLTYNMCRFTQIVRLHADWIKPRNTVTMG